jgi:hypothetical protein
MQALELLLVDRGEVSPFSLKFSKPVAEPVTFRKARILVHGRCRLPLSDFGVDVALLMQQVEVDAAMH